MSRRPENRRNIKREAVESADYQEGIRAFIEKRRAKFGNLRDYLAPRE